MMFIFHIATGRIVNAVSEYNIQGTNLPTNEDMLRKYPWMVYIVRINILYSNMATREGREYPTGCSGSIINQGYIYSNS